MITARPITIRESQITASSVSFPDTGETAWTTTAYVVGNTVSYEIYGLQHKFYCKTAHTGAADKLPEAYPDDEANTYWLDLGACNKYAPFQFDRNTQNDAASPYSVTVSPGARFTHIAIGNVEADDVTLEIYDSGDNLIETHTKQMLVRDVYSWYDWLYQEHRQIKKHLFADLPPVSTHKFKLTFTRASGNVKVGHIIPGVGFDIGSAQYKTQIIRENFSVISRDTFGEAKMRKRRNIPGNNLALVQEKGQVNKIRNLIDDLNATVTFWAGIVETTDGYFESVFTIGIYKDYTYSLDGPNHAIADIEIQEL